MYKVGTNITRSSSNMADGLVECHRQRWEKISGFDTPTDIR